MEENELKITETLRLYLLDIAKWGRFLAIVGFVSIGLGVISSLVGLGRPAAVYSGLGGMSTIITIGYLFFLALGLYVCINQYRFSIKIKKGIIEGGQEIFTDSFRNLKNLYVFYGVLTIIWISLYILAILFMVMGGVMGGML